MKYRGIWSREYEAICETTSVRESGPYGGLFDDKTEGRKSRVTVPLIENKFHRPNQLKYLMGDFNKVSSHLKQQVLPRRFFFKFKYWNAHTRF
jgi:hypothetical protein